MKNVTDIEPLELILRSALYQEFSFYDGGEGAKAVFGIIYFPGKFDWYCPDCEKMTTYQGTPNYPDDPKDTSSYMKSKLTYYTAFEKHYDLAHFYNGTNFCVPIRCLRGDQYSRSHRVEVWFKVEKNKLIKVGQYPSATTVEQFENERYRKVLGNKYGEFNRAIGLHNFNIGIGSFVYLRRIFEHLIHQAATDHPELLEEGFALYRMDEKILALRSVLPPYLVEKRRLYAILSKGVHELTETQCLRFFPSVKHGIELILDEKRERMIREEKIRTNSKDIDSLFAELDQE